ncbi:MAG TPA: DUF4065 domain-containing protein [Candidatus Onthocola stercoravium]|nr:DUF4065 domain-containing protein [Candidatus Onthocola stercoravium]
MTNIYKCDNCESTNTYVKKHQYNFIVKDVPIKVISKTRFCKNCDSIVEDELLGDHALKQAYQIYNEKYGISPSDIINLRKSYGLTQELFSKIIGCARKTLISYENGSSIPNDNFYIILKMLLNDSSMINNLVLANEKSLTPKDLSTIKEKFGNVPNNLILMSFFDNSDNLTDLNGYTKFNINRIEDLIRIITSTPISKTRVLKEMFYSDFLNYKNTGESITGLEYIKYPFGPVPNNYEILLHYLFEKEIIDIKVRYFNDKEYIAIIAKNKPTNKHLTKEQIHIINKVKEFFKNYNAEEISEYSHQEKAYKETKYKEKISYDYAFDIDLK